MDDQKINDLIYEIQNLVTTLGKGGTATGGGGSAATDKNTTRLVTALGMLSTRIESASKAIVKSSADQTNANKKASAKLEEFSKSVGDVSDDVKDFSKSVEKISDELDKAATEAAESAAATKKKTAADIEAARVSKLTSQERIKEEKTNARAAYQKIVTSQVETKRITAGQATLAKGLSNLGITLGRDSEKITDNLRRISDVGRGLGNTGKAVGSFATSMSETTRGFEALNPIIDAVASAFSSIPFVGGVAKSLAEATKLVVAQLQQATNSFQDIAKVGGLTSQGMTGVRKQFLATGMTLQSYTKTITANSQTLARFQGSVGDGATVFSKTAGLVQKDFGKGLQRIGFGIDEIGETTAAYIARQTKLGMTQGKSVDQLAAGSARYMKELDELSRLTGASKDELKKQQDEALREVRFRSVIEKMKRSGDVEQIRQAEQLIATQSALSKENKGLGKAFRDTVSGAITSDEAREGTMATGGKLSEMVEKSKLGVGAEGVAATMNDFRESVQTAIPTILDVGQFGVEYAGNVADLADFANGVVRSGTQVTTSQEALAGGVDALTNATVDAQKNMQKVMLQMNELGFHYMTDAARSVKFFTGSIDKLTDTLNRYLKLDKGAEKIAQGASKSLLGGDSPEAKAFVAQELKDRNLVGLITRSQFMAQEIIDWFSSKKDTNVPNNVPEFATGGIATGPTSGHLAKLHGTEAVIPLSGGSIPLKILSSGIDAGPAFSPQTETNYILEKNTEELVRANMTLTQMLEAITGGATITGGGGGGARTSEQVAQEALAEHDHAHPHGEKGEKGGAAGTHDHAHPHGEKGEKVSPELVAQISKGFVDPLKNMNVTSGMMRNDGKTYHGGIDLGGKIGDSIMAPISGKITRVLEAGKGDGGFGNAVEIEDSVTGMKHILAHMDKSMAKVGDTVKAGTQIGTLGNTGQSTAPHLHHEIKDKFGKRIDPSQFYSNAKKGGKAYGGQLAGQYPGGPPGSDGAAPGFGSTAGGAATGNPNIARQGQRAGATQYPGPGAAPGMGDGLGKMSEKYETGGRGSGTVGWDKVGGTSYGKYQIASKVGAMKDFLKFAEQSGRGDVAKKLRDAGAESDTGGTSGKSVDVWKQMAAGGELGDLEHQFIKKRSFDPAMAGVKDPKLKKMIEGNKGLQEMMWSTAVQHGGGGAAGIMNKTYKEGMSQEDLVKAVYAERGTRFGGSTEEVQKSVKNRFVSEQGDVMAMLGMPAGKGGTATAAAPGMPAAGGAPGMPAAAPGAGGGLMGMLGGMLGGAQAPAGGGAAPGAGGGLMGMLGGMLGGGATGAQPSAGTGAASPLENITQSVMGMFGLGGGTPVAGPGQADVAGVTAGGAPGAIGGDIGAITQAMEAQTSATQNAITSGMENLTTQLVDKLGGGSGGAADPAVPALLTELISAQREQTSAINRLIQVNTS